MTKIAKPEFENYSKQFLSVFVRMLNTPELKEDSNENQEKGRKIVGLLLSEIELGNVFALYGACKIAEEASKEDFSAIESRVKEHIIARGYYNLASPLTLAEFRERRNKMGWEKMTEFWKNEERRWQLLLEMSEENRNFVCRIFNLIEKGDEIFPEEDKSKLTEEEWKKIGFIWEDFLKVLEEAQKKYEETEREREREREQNRSFSHHP